MGTSSQKQEKKPKTSQDTTNITFSCSWNTSRIMLWAWMLCSTSALGNERKYALGMDALATVGSWDMNGSMLRAWMLWSPYALGTRTEVCFGHECSSHRMILERKRKNASGMDALVTRTEVCFGHECSSYRMILEQERNYASGMNALVTVCSWNTNGSMLWAWILWMPCSTVI